AWASNGAQVSVRVPLWEEAGETAVEVSVGPPGLSPDDVLEIVLGDQSGGSRGLRPQTFSQARKRLPIFVDLGSGRYLPARPTPVLEVTGGPPDRLRILLPSTARPGQPFDGLLKVEDRHGNLARFYAGAVEFHSFERVADIPEPTVVLTPRSGSHRPVRRIVLRQGRGVVRLQAGVLGTNDQVRANPVLVLADEEPYHLYWGVLHGTTEFSGGAGTPAAYFRVLRDENLLNFGALGDRLPEGRAAERLWGRIVATVEAADEPGRFVALPAYEWAGTEPGDGVRLVVYSGADRAASAPSPGDYPRPWHLFQSLHDAGPGDALVVARRTASAASPCDFSRHDPVHERLVEIYSADGCAERSVHEGNPYPMRPPGLAEGIEAPGVPLDAGEAPLGFVLRALALGWRVGFVAGGGDRHGHPGDRTRTGPEPFRYRDGLVGVWATDLTREAIFEGLRERRTIASTGPRIIVLWRIGGHFMGTDAAVAMDDPLRRSRPVEIQVHGEERIATVEIVRNGQVVYSRRPAALDTRIQWRDEDPLDEVAIRPRTGRPPFVFYYVRVMQADGEMAWASPIWLTLKE
ncbi:MAG: DUF3604 domain-containing protein, partial [Armatimonadetes bacterium]|nr:DUF3604 domain-containing protein [Armatimonadota bacterium]